MRYSKNEVEESIKKLKELLPKANYKIYTILRSVSKSGMSRVIDLYLIIDNKHINISWYVARVLNMTLTENGVKVYGCGMDVGFELVYLLGYELYNDGYKLTQKWL